MPQSLNSTSDSNNIWSVSFSKGWDLIVWRVPKYHQTTGLPALSKTEAKTIYKYSNLLRNNLYVLLPFNCEDNAVMLNISYLYQTVECPQ